MSLIHFCVRNLILSWFVLLSISGLIVCSTSSYFFYQNSKYEYYNYHLENIQGPPTTLFTMGLLTSLFAMFCWFVMDNKYNGAQFSLITVVLIIIMLIEVSVVIWTLIMHGRLDTLLSVSLEKSLKIFEISDPLSSNITIDKLNCCSYNETMLDRQILSSHHCCDFEKMDDETRITCNEIHGKECKHLIINQNRSSLHKISLLTLCSIVLKICSITSIIYYAKFLRKRKLNVLMKYIDENHTSFF